LVPDENPDPNDLPGHVCVPELSIDNYRKDKNRIKDSVLPLVEEGTKNIVLPFG